MGDPWDFFFFKVTTGGGVRRLGFWRNGARHISKANTIIKQIRIKKEKTRTGCYQSKKSPKTIIDCGITGRSQV